MMINIVIKNYIYTISTKINHLNRWIEYPIKVDRTLIEMYNKYISNMSLKWLLIRMYFTNYNLLISMYIYMYPHFVVWSIHVFSSRSFIILRIDFLHNIYLCIAFAWSFFNTLSIFIQIIIDSFCFIICFLISETDGGFMYIPVFPSIVSLLSRYAL